MKKSCWAVILILLLAAAANGEMICHEENITLVTVQKDIGGRISVWSEVTMNDGGKQIKKRIDMYTYYPSGEINIINQKEYDGNDKLSSEKDIAHSTDNKPPIVSTGPPEIQETEK